MATSYTSLLGLALPAAGELDGTWGDTVNTAITTLVDSAVAGTTTLSADADVTLTTTQGSSNQARQAIILWTATGSVTRNITAPASSKAYIVVNKTGGTQSIVLRGVGPTTGVTILPNQQALVAWNGSDFVRVGGGAVSLTADVTGTLPRANGGTGLATAPTNGQVLIGNGTGYALGTLTAGTGITVTNGAGSITIASTAAGGTVTSVGLSGGTTGLTVTGSPVTSSGTITMGGTLVVSNGGTGASTLTGILKGNGTGPFTAVTAPSGALVGTTDTQTLTSKTLNTPVLNNPVLSGSVTGTFTFTTAPTFGTALTFPNAVEFGNGAHLTGEITRESVGVGASAIDSSTGSYFTKTISSNTTFTFIDPPAAGTLGEFTFALTHNSSAVPTWPAGVVWEGGVTPTYTSNRTSIYVFRTIDGGTRWYGVAFSNFVT